MATEMVATWLVLMLGSSWTNALSQERNMVGLTRVGDVD